MLLANSRAAVQVCVPDIMCVSSNGWGNSLAITYGWGENACPCQNSDKMRCFYDDTCPGLGCGAEGYQNCGGLSWGPGDRLCSTMCGQGINVGPPSYEAAIVVIRVDSSMLARIRMPNQADCTGCVVARGSRALVRKNRRRWNEWYGDEDVIGNV